MNNSAHVFISYSRRNIEFAKRLFQELNRSKRDVWVDWEDIPRAADWMQEIYSGIDNADTFIFLVSEHSLISEVCNQELEYALKKNKRVIPLILQKIENDVFDRVDNHWKSTTWYPIAQKNWESLKHLNWVFFDDPARYDGEFEALLTAVDQDLFHIKTHTRLLVRAQEWHSKEKNPGSLLAGDDIISAENWLQIYASTDPLPTDLHREFILSSRQAENERIAHERNLQGRARTRLQILVASFVVIILVMIFGLLPLTNNMLELQLGEDVDERLNEAALSFEDLLQDDLSEAELAASFVADSVDARLLREQDGAAFDEIRDIRREFGLQEVSYYAPDFEWADDPVYYDGPEITHNDRVQQTRERLVLDAIERHETASQLIIGSPESQVAAAIPVFVEDEDEEENDWNFVGVILVAYHINNDYILEKSVILNVEVVLMNFEEEVVASTLPGDPPDFINQLNNYGGRDDIFTDNEDDYLDYETEEGDVLRMIQHSLVINGEVQGYLFVARSFDAVINLQEDISNLFFIFSGGIIAVTVILLIALVGIPALRNRSR